MRILAIDGGGIRGIIPARVLVEFERLAKVPTHQLFDLIVGTSTGGIIALGLTKPGPTGGPSFSAQDALQLYTEKGPEIFPGGGPPTLEQRIFGARGRRGWLNPGRALSDPAQRVGSAFGGNAAFAGNARYAPDGLEGVLSEHFGLTRLSAALTPVVVTAYDIRYREPVLFASAGASLGTDTDPLMAAAARATSAGPTYLPPMTLTFGGVERILVDGGLVANNPALVAYVLAGEGVGGQDTVLISLGTGKKSGPDPDSVTYESVSTQNWAAVAAGIIQVAFDGTSYLADSMLARLMGSDSGQRHYWRFQANLTEGDAAMDNVSRANLEALVREGERVVADNQAAISELAAALAAGGRTT